MDEDTVVTRVYVLVGACCQTVLGPESRRPGPAPALSRSEGLSLELLGQWTRFTSEQDCYRSAEQHLRPYFLTLPHRTHYHRQFRRHQAALAQCARSVAELLQRGSVAGDVLEVAPSRCAMPSAAAGVGWRARPLSALVGAWAGSPAWWCGPPSAWRG